MINLTVTKDLDNDFIYVQQCLGDLQRKAPNALRNAVNQTARRYRDEVQKRVQSEFVIAKKSMVSKNNLMKIRQAKVSDMTAVLTSKGEMSELMQFEAKPKKVTNDYKRKPKSYSARVLSDSSLKELNGNPKPFVVRFKSGHVAMVARVPGKRMQTNPEKEFMKKLLSPAVPHMIENDKVDAQRLAADMARNEMTSLINAQIDKILGGKR